MSSADIASLLGYLLSAWALGFAAGTTLTKTKEAMNHVS